MQYVGRENLSHELLTHGFVGNSNFRNTGGDMLGIQKMGSTLHWGPRWDANRWWLTSLPKSVNLLELLSKFFLISYINLTSVFFYLTC